MSLQEAVAPRRGRLRLRPLSRAVTRPVSVLVLVAWVATMAVLVNRSYLQTSFNLATDLSRYGSTAQWRGVYYRGAKIGFTVRQVLPTDDGFQLEEDGQLEMTLIGATAAARIRTIAQVDDTFALRSFEFSLDPGTGPITVNGRVERPDAAGSQGDGWRLIVDVTTAGVTRTEERALAAPPLLGINLGRRLASEGLTPGDRHEWMLFDPATLSNMPVVLEVGAREVVRVGNTRLPAFRVDLELAGLQTTSWVTDTGEVVREESPLGILTVREPANRATIMAIPGLVQTDLLQAAAVVPVMSQHIDDPRDVRRLRVRLEGADLSGLDLDGVGQTFDGDVIEIMRPEPRVPGPPDPEAAQYLAPEPLIESDDPVIQAEAALAAGALVAVSARAEALTRYVNGLLDKKPTVGFPSAREVLRTKIGDCNEHTALYVAMARALGIPTRVAVGLVYMRGAFYYHAWPEVYLDEGEGQASWLAVDPTLNQFPADGTHLRLARGGLDRQTVILPLIGRLQMTVLDLELARLDARAACDAGVRAAGLAVPDPDPPARHRGLVWVFRSMIAIHDLVKTFGDFTAVDRVSLEARAGEIHGFLGPNGAGKTTTIRIIAGLLKPTAGQIVVNGHDLATEPEAAKASLGFIPDRPFIYEKLTAGEFLRFHAGLYGIDGAGVGTRVGQMLELFELKEWEQELVEAFSHGMKQRLVMCAAFLHRPQAVLVDEPMVGLDPRGARLIKNVFRKMAERGVAILMSTHTLEVAEEMCDRISIIAKGQIIARGTVDELHRLAGGTGSGNAQLTQVFLKLTGGTGLQEIDGIV